MPKKTATSDGLANLHFDHDDGKLWVDIHRDANAETGAEIILLAAQEDCYILSAEDCDAEHLPGGIVRYHLAYREATECP